MWLLRFEAEAERRGAKVLWAKDSAEVREHVLGICREHGLKKAIKSKSMVSEEAGLNDALEADGVRPVETDERVSCVIPGHHVPGRELYADRLVVVDAPFEWELAGNCAFVSTFAYGSG